MNSVLVGTRSFAGKELRSGSVVLESPISGNDLKFDSLNVTVLCEDKKYFQLADSNGFLLLDSSGTPMIARPRLDDPEMYEYGTPISFFKGDALKGSFYFETAEDKGNYIYNIKGIPDIELIDNGTDHYGGMYTGEPFIDVLLDVIGTAIPYTVEERLRSIKIYGHLPVAARRENLRQLLFATGAVLKRTKNGTLDISYLDKTAYKKIDRSRFYNALSIPKTTGHASIVVVEHSYIALSTDEEKTLFDGKAESDEFVSPKGSLLSGTLVNFGGAPYHDLRVEGASILEYGVNYAIISPSSQCVLKGKEYTHVTKEVKKTTAGIPKDKVSKIKTSRAENATLVSFVNSESVAERYLAYSAMASSATANIVAGDEYPGSSVSMDSTYQKLYKGFLQTLDFSINGMSSTFKASALFALGYDPPEPGNTYKNVSVVKESGYWVVPDGVFKIRSVLISGGTGGFSGLKGESGGDGQSHNATFKYTEVTVSSTGYVYGKAGEGGGGGAGGHGGKIHEITIDVTPGQIFKIGVGLGGKGALYDEEIESNPGLDGSPTTLDAYSSESGAVRKNGFLELISGVRYAYVGGSGISGCKGTGNAGSADNYIIENGPSITFEGITYSSGPQGEFKTEKGGISGSGFQEGHSYGGLGGGSAIGGNGENGTNGFARIYMPEYRKIDGTVKAGAGGKGAGAVSNKDTPELIGVGGSGGHGGGGGGGAGLGILDNTTWNYQPGFIEMNARAYNSLGGLGGDGGEASTGAPGGAIIYW